MHMQRGGKEGGERRAPKVHTLHVNMSIVVTPSDDEGEMRWYSSHLRLLRVRALLLLSLIRLCDIALALRWLRVTGLVRLARVGVGPGNRTLVAAALVLRRDVRRAGLVDGLGHVDLSSDVPPATQNDAHHDDEDDRDDDARDGARAQRAAARAVAAPVVAVGVGRARAGTGQTVATQLARTLTDHSRQRRTADQHGEKRESEGATHGEMEEERRTAHDERHDRPPTKAVRSARPASVAVPHVRLARGRASTTHS
jgi:hypothetical protein